MQINALLYIRRGEYKDIGHTVFVQKARKGNNYAARKKMPGANYICPMENGTLQQEMEMELSTVLYARVILRHRKHMEGGAK